MLGELDELKTRAFELRQKKGLTYAEIGKELGINHQTAWNYVNEVLDSFKPKPEDVERFRSMQVSRLEAVLRTLWPKVEAGDLQALDRWVKIDQRIAALRGLEIQKHEHELGDKTLDAINNVDSEKVIDDIARAIIRKTGSSQDGAKEAGQEGTGEAPV
jgi:transcriptional regulator with XRE-family HTH domain